MLKPDDGFTRNVVIRIAILSALIVLGVWADSRTSMDGAAHPEEPSAEHVGATEAGDGGAQPVFLNLEMTLEGVIAALDSDMVWQEAEGEDDTWIGIGDWTYVILSGDPYDLSGVHMYHKEPEYAAGLPAEERESLQRSWKEQSLQRVQGFIHRLLPVWSFDDLQAWALNTVAGFEREECNPYCMDFTLVQDRIVMLAEYPDETLSVGLFALGDFLYAHGLLDEEVFGPGLDLSVDDVLGGISVGEGFVLRGNPEYEDGLPVYSANDEHDGKVVKFKGNPFNLRHVRLSQRAAFDVSGVRNHVNELMARFVHTVVPESEVRAVDHWLSDAMTRVADCDFCDSVGLVVDDRIELRLNRAEDTLSISAQALGPQ